MAKGKKHKHSKPRNTRWVSINRCKVYQLLFRKKLKDYVRGRQVHGLKYTKLGEPQENGITLLRSYDFPTKTTTFPGVGVYVGGVRLREYHALQVPLTGLDLKQARVKGLSPRKYTSNHISTSATNGYELALFKHRKPTKLLQTFVKNYRWPTKIKAELRKQVLTPGKVRISTKGAKPAKLYFMPRRRSGQVTQPGTRNHHTMRLNRTTPLDPSTHRRATASNVNRRKLRKFLRIKAASTYHDTIATRSTRRKALIFATSGAVLRHQNHLPANKFFKFGIGRTWRRRKLRRLFMPAMYNRKRTRLLPTNGRKFKSFGLQGSPNAQKLRLLRRNDILESLEG